jgi:hypothetical protein
MRALHDPAGHRHVDEEVEAGASFQRSETSCPAWAICAVWLR